MKIANAISLGLVLLAAATACGEGGAPMVVETDSAPPNDDDQPPLVDSSGAPPEEPTCTATRHTLLNSMPCGQLRFGDVDADGVQDLLATSGRAGAIRPEIRERLLHTYIGGSLPLGAPELHCCTPMGAPFDLLLRDRNGDGRADPTLFAYRPAPLSQPRALFTGTRGPQGGYVGLDSPLDLGPDSPLLRAGNLLDDTEGTTLVMALPHELRLYRGEVSGWTFVPESATPLAAPARAIATIDLDDDGRDEVVVRNEQGVLVYRSDGGDGPLVAGDPIAQPDVLATTLLVGQVDGAGPLDIVLLGFDGTRVGLVDAGTVTWVFTWGPDSENPVALARVDDDPHLDVVEARDGQVVAYFGNGDGTFDSLARVLSEGVGPEPAGLDAGDLDGDGLDEIAVCDDLGVLVVSTAGLVRD